MQEKKTKFTEEFQQFVNEPKGSRGGTNDDDLDDDVAGYSNDDDHYHHDHGDEKDY